MGKSFVKKFARFFLVVTIILAGLVVLLGVSLLLRKKWIVAVPGVVTAPSRPILKSEDVKPDSAFDLMLRASGEEEKVFGPDTNPKITDPAELVRQTLAQPPAGKVDLKKDFKEETPRLNIEPWSEAGFPATSEILKKSQAALDLARKSTLAGNPQVASYMSPLDTFPYLSQVMMISRVFAASATMKTAQGDFAGAYGDLNTTVDFADILSRGGVLIQRLVEMSCEAIALRSMRFIALQNEVPAEVARKTIQHLAEVDRHMEPWSEVYRQECRIVPVSVDLMFDPGINPMLYTSTEDAFKWIRLVGPITGGSHAQMRKDLESHYAYFIAIADKPYDPVNLMKVESLFLISESGPKLWLLTEDPLGYLTAKWSTPLLLSMITRHCSLIAMFRATEIVIAVRQYEQEKKHPPAGLNELVPGYFPAVPLDPFDGKPMRYAVNPDGSWAVYSVGPDQSDQGGTPPSHVPTNYTDPGDLVYPSTEVSDAKEKLKKK